MDGVHDMGGMHGFGPVVVAGGDEVFHEDWEARVFALYHLSNVRGLVGGPGGRAVRESMDPVHYLEASYYERWLWSAERRMEAKGTIAPGDVEAMMARLAVSEAPPTAAEPELLLARGSRQATPCACDACTRTGIRVARATYAGRSASSNGSSAPRARPRRRRTRVHRRAMERIP